MPDLGLSTDRELLDTLLSFEAYSATIAAAPLSGFAPLSVSFTGGNTGGTGPFTFFWTFGDGGTSTSQNPSHTFFSTGTYTVTLTVTDSLGFPAVATLVISAIATPNNIFVPSRRVHFG